MVSILAADILADSIIGTLIVYVCMSMCVIYVHEYMLCGMGLLLCPHVCIYIPYHNRLLYIVC